MSKLADALRERNIFNTHNLLVSFGKPGKDIGITFYPAESRSCGPANCRVWSPSFRTKENAPWYDYGAQSFTGIKKYSHPKAIAWTEENYSVKMVCGPFGDYIPIEVLEAAKKFAKEKA